MTRKIIAKHPGQCCNCEGDIRPGQRIWWAPRGKSAHVNCELAQIQADGCPACKGLGAASSAPADGGIQSPAARPEGRCRVTVSVAKRVGLTPFFERSFDDVSEAARFAESWYPMHVTAHDEAGKQIDVYQLSRAARAGSSVLLPFKNDDGSDALCPFCGASESTILADDELLHACESCDRAWYIDSDENVLPADRCPACEAETITVFDDGRRLCGKCGHQFFFDGLTYVDPSTVESECAE